MTLVNTVMGMAIDPETRRPRLGRAPAAAGCRARPSTRSPCGPCYDVHRALPDLPIVGVGGVARGADAVELLLAGATAVQVGTATFADPRAPGRVLDELESWCGATGWRTLHELIGDADG